jgi:uncharacterized protein YukE
MVNFFGADVEQLRRLGNEFGAQAQAIDSVVMRLSSRISSVAWRGPDARRFQSDWQDHLSPDLRKAASALIAASQSALRSAQEQEQASGAASPNSRPLPFMPSIADIPDAVPAPFETPHGALPSLVPPATVDGVIRNGLNAQKLVD